MALDVDPRPQEFYDPYRFDNNVEKWQVWIRDIKKNLKFDYTDLEEAFRDPCFKSHKDVMAELRRVLLASGNLHKNIQPNQLFQADFDKNCFVELPPSMHWRITLWQKDGAFNDKRARARPTRMCLKCRRRSLAIMSIAARPHRGHFLSNNATAAVTRVTSSVFAVIQDDRGKNAEGRNSACVPSPSSTWRSSKQDRRNKDLDRKRDRPLPLRRGR